MEVYSMMAFFQKGGLFMYPILARVCGRHGYYNRALAAIEPHPEREPQYVEYTSPCPDQGRVRQSASDHRQGQIRHLTNARNRSGSPR